MYQRIEIPAKQVRDVAKTFGYRKRKVNVIASETVVLHGVNWAGGSINEYTPICLSTGKADHKARDKFGHAAPWDNKYEGMEVPLIEDFAIVRTGYFCGKESVMTIYVHPANMPNLIPEN